MTGRTKATSPIAPWSAKPSPAMTVWAAAQAMNTTRRVTMAMKIERFQPEGMNVRMSGGQPSYSHVVTVSGSGKIVYTAGQLARDIDGNCVGIGDMRAQMEQTFQNLDRCLKAAGATWADVVKTNTFVTDFDEFQKCSDVRMRYPRSGDPNQHDCRRNPPRRPRFHDRDRGRRCRQFIEVLATAADPQRYRRACQRHPALPTLSQKSL